MSKNRNSVIFLKDWALLVQSLSPENQLYFWGLFVNYDYDDEQICKNDFVLPIWNFIRKQLDNMHEKYETSFVQRNRVNGAKGGRPKKNTKTQVNPKNPVGNLETQKTLNKNVNENLNNNINENLNKNKGVLFPFESEIFKTQWQLWKVYKSKEFGFKYKSEISENGALAKLEKISGGDEKTAVEIIQQSINEGWKGFFELSKPTKNPGAGGAAKLTAAQAFKNQFENQNNSKTDEFINI
ncbi:MULTISPECIES: DUF6291 domain-containing protein [Flavobacteriaceae]|uniref:DUF6291 domain-containing protein n=2 Tax=Flavobacteriaceae TaxID=49546 RepID=A0A4Y8ARS5_9FLAO|nr:MULTISPECIES: DUF6291 domain-containing protein [Flavobacteriaceae]TEW73900.1 hypothetical protein E2488_10505 [Gramella jeungdoensis]GGK38570.1 hypothetical protein GCM10007963_03330 [Lutibacter litoralis]